MWIFLEENPLSSAASVYTISENAIGFLKLRPISKGLQEYCKTMGYD
jgi:hypothetical protein